MKEKIITKYKKLIYIIVLFLLSFSIQSYFYSKYVTTIGGDITINVRNPNYTVVFHSNYDDDETSSQSFVYGVSQTLMANSFSRVGYVFTGWNLLADGTGDSFSDEESVSNLSNTEEDVVDLYAQWEVADSETCSAGNICYSGNDDDGDGEMDDQAVSSNSTVMLIASNYSRPGYGFAGWNTAKDGTGANYGPNESIKVGDVSSEGLQLYARWVHSSGNLQNWQGCSSLSQGEVIALTDDRDGNVYTVTKYPDDKCWMMENLRLDLSNPDLEISAVNTNAPSSTFATSIDNSHPVSSDSFCESYSSSCLDKILYNSNNTNRGLTSSHDANNSSSSWYSYGVYYNWYTATAGYGLYSMTTAGLATEGDICPSGWQLPNGYSDSGDYSELDVLIGGNGKNQGSGSSGANASLRWRSYPYNYIYSGEQRGSSGYNRNVSGSYATRNASNSQRAVNFWIRDEGVNLNSNSTPKYRGQTVRCIINEDYTEIGNIHYDANGGSGSMADVTNVDLGTATASNNQFTNGSATFSSWNTSPDGSGVVVQEGGSVVSAANHMGVSRGGTLTLYAMWTFNYQLVYDGNGQDAGSMSIANLSSISTGANVVPVAPNYSRAGYGFAGWSLDSNASSKIINHESVMIYGPSEKIQINNSFLSHADSSNKITLYAVWLPEDLSKTMQTFSSSECSAMSIGDVVALKDIRDNNVYTVAKLNDNHCWMVENLRLEPSATNIDNTNTNLPTTAFINSLSSSVSADTMCNTNDTDCVDHIYFNSNAIDLSLTSSHKNNAVNSSWYGYGVMYNWYTATAGNGVFSVTSGDVSGDICPSGWRLPTGGSSGEFVTLNNVENNGSTSKDAGLRKFPVNLIYSGDYNYNKPGGRDSYGRFWSATPNGNNNAYRLGLASSGATPAGSWNKWDAFAVRCIVK